MKMRFLLASLLFAGITGTGFAQDDQQTNQMTQEQRMVLSEEEAQARLEGSEQLKQNYETYKTNKQELVDKANSLLQEAGIDPQTHEPYDVKFERENVEFKSEKESDGDISHQIEMDDRAWSLEKKGDQVKEKYEGPEVEYKYKKNGNDVKEKIEGHDVEYQFEKSASEVEEQYEDENKEWSYEKKADGELKIKYEDDQQEYQFEKKS